MKRNLFHITVLLLAVTAFTACMDENIKDPNGTGKEIALKFDAAGYTFYYEDGVNLSPAITYANGDDSTLNVFSYEWIRKGKDFSDDRILSTERTLNLPTSSLDLGKQQLLLVVTDERYGTKYSAQVQIEVILKNSVGLFVLSKDASSGSHLGVFTIDKEGTFTPSPLELGNFGSEPISLIYHRMRESAQATQVAYLQITQSGTPGTIDICLKTMTQEPQSSLNEQFGGAVPEQVASTYYGDHFVLTRTQSGDLYKRNETVVSRYKVPYASTYFPAPVPVEGSARITHWANTSTMNENTGLYTLLMYDALNARFLSMSNHAISYSVNGTGAISVVNNYALAENGSDNARRGAPDLKGYQPGDKSPVGNLDFPALNNLSEYEMIGFTFYYLDLYDTYMYDVMSSKAVAILKKKSNGKYYMLTFAHEGNYNRRSMSASLLDFVEMEQSDGATLGGNMILAGWCDPTLGSYPYVFFTNAERNKVYRYDCTRHQRRLVYTSNSPVTALYVPEPGGSFSKTAPLTHAYFNKLLIGTQNGDIVCMGLPDLASGEFVELHTYRTGKEIVDFAFVPDQASASSNLAK